MERKKIDELVLIFFVIIVILLSFFTVKGLLSSIFMAFVFSSIFYPLFLRLKKIFRSEAFSALLIVCFFVILLVLPIILFVPSLIRETMDVYDKIQNLPVGDFFKEIFSSISEETAASLNLQYANIVSKLFSSLVNEFNSLIINLPVFLLYFVIFLFLFYYFIRDYENIEKSLLDLIPAKKEDKEKFSTEFKNVTGGIFYGQILVGILQGLLMGLFLYVIGFDNVVFLTFVGIIAGILPLVGPSIVWIPVSLLLIANGQVILALVFILYGLFVSWFADGFLRPFILSKKTSLSLSLSFISMIGGVYSFGFLGVLLGPLFISYLILIIEFYKGKPIKKAFFGGQEENEIKS